MFFLFLSLLSGRNPEYLIEHHINSVEGNGTLGSKWQGDPRNIVFLKNHNHPDKFNEHVHGDQGHRGNTKNSTRGRLIDRERTLKSRQRCKQL